MPSNSGLYAILMRFPGPVTLYPSRRKWALVLAGCGLFAAGGIWMIAGNAPWGWFVLIVFLIGAIVAAVALLPWAGALTLDGNGFVMTSLFRTQRIQWQDAEGFEAQVIPPALIKFVVFDQISATGRAISKFNATIAGRNGALPDTYGFSADDLASLMRQWRARALTASGAAQAKTLKH
jgi:hypothetical protein